MFVYNFSEIMARKKEAEKALSAQEWKAPGKAAPASPAKEAAPKQKEEKEPEPPKRKGRPPKEASAEDLVDHLQQVFVILGDTEQGRVIGYEIIFQQCFKTECVEEFLYQKKTSIGRKLLGIKIYDKLLIAFELDLSYT